MSLLVDPRKADDIALRAIFSLKARKQIKAEEPKWKPAYYQVPHGEDWLYWAMVGGRGIGKTDSGAHYLNSYMLANPGHRAGIIAPTLGDARGTCVEGETGLLNANPEIHFNRSWGELLWPNGAKAQLFGAYSPDDVERLRGPQFHLVWCDEFAAWRQIAAAWDMMRLGLRLGPRPHVIITTTPKPRPKLIEILSDPQTQIARTEDGRVPTTDDNPHLHPSVRAELYRQYGGTRLGRQELGGELLTDREGALWTREMIERNRVRALPQMYRIVVGIDPSGTSSRNAQGIVAAGLGMDGHGYVLADATCKLSPEGWGRRAVQVYHHFHADRIVAERNYGGDMVAHVIQTIDPKVAYKDVVASRGKVIRAEPIAALYEQNRVHHVGNLNELEDQMTNWVPQDYDGSPDRVDALVWALTELMLGTVVSGGAAIGGERPESRYVPR
jgi:phage terminase large subunit-like protein